MKKIILLLIIQISLFLNYSYSQQYWTQQAGGNTIDAGTDISIDGVGNVYSTGYFTSIAAFGPFSLTSSGAEDIYLTKTDPLGHFIWAVRAGGGGSDRPRCLKTDAAGNSYITGYFYGTATFGSYSITSAGLQDIFIAKYDSSGTCIWVKSAGSTGTDIGYGITVDGSGNVIVTGEFIGTGTFGSTILYSMDTTIDAFITKLDSNGNFLWTKQGAGPYIDRGIDVVCDNSGNIYVTGQFTDTIMFDVPFDNNMYNAIFLIKYDANGNEQWVTRAGGGTYNIANAIAVDNSGNILLTGDFMGTLTFFSTSNAMSYLTYAYTNKIFVAKYNPSGNFVWSTASGSNGEVTSRNLATDASGNPYIIGNFTCKMNDFADKYGQGTFNSVGFWDIFVAKFNSSGLWQWSRQSGGHGNEYGAGIALNSSNEIFTTGSFDNDFIIPERANTFLGYGNNYYLISCGNYNNSYCGDNNYFTYALWRTEGYGDIFIGKNVDTIRQPYDFYIRKDTFCNRNPESVCINKGDTACPDTIKFCAPGGHIFADTKTCYSNVYYYDYIGPNFHFQWSNGDTTYNPIITSTGNYSVTVTSYDGCLTSTDSVYVIVNPAPSMPTITDNHGFNTNAIYTIPVILCGDSALLTGGNYGNNHIRWSGPSGSDTISTIEATQSGWYRFTVTNSFGCSDSNVVLVQIGTPFDTIAPKMICPTDQDGNDTVTLCAGDSYKMYVYDTISNPNGYYVNIPFTIIHWHATPNSVQYTLTTDTLNSPLPEMNEFYPTQTGWDTVTAEWVRINDCDTNIVYCSKAIYVIVNPLPIDSVIGNLFYCPGDSTLLYLTGGTSYMWESPYDIYYYTVQYTDSIWASNAGVYYYWVTNSFGCRVEGEIYVEEFPQPVVTMIPYTGLICPYDSVLLFCNGTGTFVWHGPSGPVGGDTNLIYVNQPGNYYCIRTDTNGCALVSNFVEVVQYNTPYLMVSPSNIVCAGDSILLTVITSPTATINWLPPLSGSSLTMYVDTSGNYSCEVVCCNITTIVSANVTVSHALSQISPNGPLTVCVGDSILLTGNSGMVMYVWNPDSVISQILWVSQPGTYYLTTYDGNGCTATDSIVITQTPAYTVPYLTAAPSAMFCAGDSVLITVNSDSLSLVQWLTPLSGNSFNQYVDSSGIYICNVTYCNIETTDTITVIRFVPLATITASGPLTFCSGDSVILSANSGMTTYLWTPGNSTSQTITVTQSGTYILRTTDSLGCAAFDSDTVVVTPAYTTPWLQASPDSLFCSGDSILITLNSNSLSTILWLAPLSGNSFTQEINTSGTYICNVTYCGITTTDSITVSIIPSAAQITASGPLTFCSGDSVVLTANSGMTTYLWNPGGSTNQSLTVYQSGTYVLTTTNSIGCPAYDSVTVLVTPAYSSPWLSVAPDSVFCAGNSVVITVNSSSYSIINWLAPLSGNSFTQTINTPGTYICTVTYCGIETSDSITITQANPLAQITASGRIPICAGDTVMLTANSGMSNYLWNPGFSNQQYIFADSANTYTLTTTDSHGCTATDSIIVSVQTDTPPIITDTTVCSGVSITLFVTGNPTIEWFDSINSINPFTTGNSYTTPNLTSTTTYYVLMDSGMCKSARVAITVTIEQCCLIIPNVFTPNNDGRNDYWSIEGKALKDVHVKIYDRWGLLIYDMAGLKNEWHGQIMNTSQLAPDGVYYWIADLTDIFDNPTQQKGYIELIRNK